MSHCHCTTFASISMIGSGSLRVDVGGQQQESCLMRGPELERGQAGALQMSKCVNISFIITNIQVQSTGHWHCWPDTKSAH